MKSLFRNPASQDPIRRALSDAALAADIGPWRSVVMPMVGGITALGFDRTSEDMLVTSITGQSVMCGVMGEVLYRNREQDGLDVAALKGTRLDQPATERFDMAGLFGGALRTQTNDGWSVERIMSGSANLRDALHSDVVNCVLHPQGASIHFLGPQWDDYTKDRRFNLLAREREDIRVFGFSWTGRTLVIATSCDIKVWSRPAPLPL